MTKSKKIAFMQPQCHVIRFHSYDVISTSGDAPARSGANEEYEVETTSTWF